MLDSEHDQLDPLRFVEIAMSFELDVGAHGLWWCTPHAAFEAGPASVLPGAQLQPAVSCCVGSSCARGALWGINFAWGINSHCVGDAEVRPGAACVWLSVPQVPYHHSCTAAFVLRLLYRSCCSEMQLLSRDSCSSMMSVNSHAFA